MFEKYRRFLYNIATAFGKDVRKFDIHIHINGDSRLPPKIDVEYNGTKGKEIIGIGSDLDEVRENILQHISEIRGG